MEAIKKLALTLNKCAPVSGSSRRIYEVDAKFREGRKVGLLLLEMQSEFTAQDAATNIQPFGLTLCAPVRIIT